MFKSIWDWFFDPDFGLGPAVDTKPNSNFKHIHSWTFFNTIRCGWRVENGLPVGSRVAISTAILDVEKNPSKIETKVSELRAWRKSGYEYVHTSQTIYRCNVCNVTKSVDHYAAPVKGDGVGPMIVDPGSNSSFQRKFTDTTRINVNTTNYSAGGRKEIAIEPMKRHGTKMKPVRPLPVVPMED